VNRSPMPPRRTALARGPVKLSRTALARRRSARPNRQQSDLTSGHRQPAQRPQGGRTGSGWPKETRDAVQRRSGGRCEVGLLGTCTGQAANLHHRLPRRMGGTSNPAASTACNALHLCGSGTTGCHGWIEAHRAEALGRGWLLHAGQDPAVEPATIRGRFPVWLTEAGRYVGEAA